MKYQDVGQMTTNGLYNDTVPTVDCHTSNTVKRFITKPLTSANLSTATTTIGIKKRLRNPRGRKPDDFALKFSLKSLQI